MTAPDRRGWYLLHRGWMASPDFQAEPFTEREAFLWSIEQAAFEAHRQWFNGVQYPIERGQLVTSTRKMADAFGWGHKRTYLFLGRMERCGKWQRLGTQGGKHGPTVLSVCNYERFQAPAKAKATAEGTAGDTARQQLGNSYATQQKQFLNKGNEGEGKKSAPPAPRAPAQPYSEAIAIWTELATLKGWEPLTPQLPLSDKRQKGLGNVLKAYGLDGWRQGLERAARGKVVGGPDPPNWFNLTFVCNLDNFTKTYEGNYDRSFKDRRSEQSPWLNANTSLGGSYRQPDASGDHLALEAPR